MTVSKEQVFKFIDEHQDDMIELWRKLVQQESGSSDKAGVDQLQNDLKLIFEAAGAKVRITEFETAGNALIADFAGADQPAIIFSGHVDTVFKQGTIKERPFTIVAGKAYGPGVLDMKGGIVAFLYALKALRVAGYQERPFKILLAGDEEPSHLNSDTDELFVNEAKGCAAAFNCETGFLDDGIVVGRKGIAKYTMEVHGVACHLGNDPENGRSAILEIAYKVIEIQKLTNLSEGISCSVGVIEGGTVANAAPDYAKIQIDLRCIEASTVLKMEEKLKEIAAKTYVEGTTTILNGGLLSKPMETTDGVRKLFELVKETSLENGWGTPYAKFCGGGSDAAYLVIAGVPTVCAMGVKGGRNHSKDEFAVVDTLFERAKLLAACVLAMDRF